MPRLLIHAGFHKTGTSSLQATMRKNADKIAGENEGLGDALAYNAAADSASWEEMKMLFESVFN